MLPFENDDEDFYAGTITGTLADGTALDNNFSIYNTGIYAGTGDIIIGTPPGIMGFRVCRDMGLPSI